MLKGCVRALFLVAVVVVAPSSGWAFPDVPKASAKALLVTRGRPFSSGAVFVNGKYIEPPYVVERWGTGIRINGMNVTGQVIDWNDFLKTQAGTKVVKREETVTSAAAPSAAAPAAADVDESSLDDLFDDDPKPKKKTAARPTSAAVPTTKTRTVVSYSLEGDFVPNDASKALLTRVNAVRTDIDRILRTGGFICFGDSYSQVTGDARTLREMLEQLPEMMQQASDVQDFNARVRGARMVYLNEVLRGDLFRNRIDYRKLKELRAKLKKENSYRQVLEDLSKPLF